MTGSARFLAIPFALLTAVSSADAKLVTRAVPYGDGAFEGYLAYDDAAKGGAPGVLLVHEWWGLNDYVKGRARQLAALGYAAFALDMYGRGVVTTDAKKASALAGALYGSPLMVARARAGLDALLATGLADPSRVAAIGYCFGGSAVQALAYSGAPVAGIVSFHGGLIPVPGGASGTKAKILICHGAADPFVTKEQIEAFKAAMKAGGFDWEFISYPGAVHAFTNPGADDLSRTNHLAGIGYNAAADKASWGDMLDFFGRIFGAKR
jgi:dienelactone hydrolase